MPTPTHQAPPANSPHPTEHPESAQDRLARHLQTCKRLAELALTLAEAAAAQALETLTQPQTPPAWDEPAKPDPTVVFARLSRAALQAVALERRIASDAARQPARPTYRTPNPRRPTLTHALHQAAAPHLNAAALREEMDEALDTELAADPLDETPDDVIVTRICNGFGITRCTWPPPKLKPAWAYDTS